MERELAVSTDWVWERMKGGEPPFFIELRHAGDADLSLKRVRGALLVTDDEARRHFAEVPSGRTVVVCSATPSDQPAYELVRQLIASGFKAFALAGGFKAYLSAGLPVEEVGQAKDMTRLRGG